MNLIEPTRGTDFTVQPDESIEFNEIWDLVDEYGNSVGKGYYQVIGELGDPRYIPYPRPVPLAVEIQIV